MPAPKGNQFWKARSTHGRNPIFATPDDLLEAATQYFEWVEANPLWEDKLVTFQGVATHEPVAKMRAMTVIGLCNFLDISVDCFENYRARKDFVGVTTRIDAAIRQQKFEGASADLLNANIIARDLGLADKQNVDHTTKGDKMPETVDATELARRVAFVLAQGVSAE